MPPEAASRLIIRELTSKNWKDMEALFEAKGGPKYCWCMAWRATAEETRHGDGRSRKRFLKKRVKAGTPVGLLAYQDGAPVGWCSVGPKATFRNLDNLEPAQDPEKTWSITCFYVPRERRHEGLVHALLEGAVKQAKKRKARLLEAYPVDEDSPSYRFMGFLPTFEARGFKEAGRAGSRRHVMRLDLKAEGRSGR